MRIFVLTDTYELRVSRKSHLRDHPNLEIIYSTRPEGFTWTWFLHVECTRWCREDSPGRALIWRSYENKVELMKVLSLVYFIDEWKSLRHAPMFWTEVIHIQSRTHESFIPGLFCWVQISEACHCSMFSELKGFIYEVELMKVFLWSNLLMRGNP